MSEHDLIERAARALREPVSVDPAAKQRLVTALREAPRPRVGVLRRGWRWLARPRPVMISPLAGLAAAAIITLVVVLRPSDDGAASLAGRSDAGTLPARLVVDGPVAPTGTSVEYANIDGRATVHFRLHAPGASSVALAGDFNDWDPATHVLRPVPETPGVWELVVPMPPGRHVYSFFVDGQSWIADPAAARAGDGAFGLPTSVILVGERSL